MKRMTGFTALLLGAGRLAMAQLSGGDLGNLPSQGSNTTIASTPISAGVVRQSGWSMPGGNLVANWSFENDAQFWASGSNANTRFASTSPVPWSGKYVAALTGAGSTSSNVDALISAPIRLKPGQNYTLSLMYNGATGGATVIPRVTFYRPNTPTTVLATGSGAAYSSPGTTWTVYKWTLPVQADEVLAVLTLATGPRPSGITLQFDGVLLAEGDTTSMALIRKNLLEAISISDPAGVAFHSMSKTGNESNYMLNTAGYDAFWRPDTSFLPYTVAPASAMVRQPDPLSAAKTFYSTRGGGAYPFTEVTFPTTDAPIAQNAAPGDAYSAGVDHMIISGSTLVSSIPHSDAEMYSKVTQPPEPVGEALYSYSWVRGRDKYYQLTWTDQMGKVIQTAKQLKTTTPGKYAFTLYEYYPDGKLKRTITPINYAEYVTTGTVANGLISTVTSYDQAGHVIATSSPDQGVVQYWYDMSGRLRFKQVASQVASSKYTYFRYDVYGRLISEGELVNASLTQANAEDTAYPNMSASYAGTDKPVERKGWIYDELNSTKWSARVPNVPLSTVIGTSTFPGRNGWGRLVAKYNRNSGYRGGDLDEAGRLVVDVFGYDTLGRQKVVGKYLGAVTDAADRRQSQEYRYDSAGRVTDILIDKNMDQTLLVDASRLTDQWYKYTFDDHGRLATIKNGTAALAQYTYDVLGHMTQVNLGPKSLAVSFAYTLHEQVAAINAGTATASRNYIENLSYESRTALGSVPAGTNRFDGQITRTSEQFSGQNVFHQAPARAAGTEPLKVANLTYDPAGRMTAQDVYVNRENATLDANGVASAPNYDLAPSLSHKWTYDQNDRLLTNVEGSATQYTTSAYNYTAGTNKLDNIAGCLNPSCSRDATSPGSFVYDQDGLMTADKSTGHNRCELYDATGLVLQMGVGSSNCASTGPYLHFIYDADGLMEAAINRTATATTWQSTAKHFYVRLGGVAHKEILEVWDPNTNTRTSSTKIINLMGASSVIGRRLATGEQQFYLKNHLGSVVEVVREDGSVAAIFDYQALGDLRTLRGDDPLVTNKYTGKEFFSGPGLYYFGARWYDPQLGIWITPDPAGQFMNPYAYGTEFINSIDPNGLWKLGIGITIGWDPKHGFNVGVGAALDVDLAVVQVNLDASYSKNMDGTTTASLSAGGGMDFVIVQANARVGISNNSQDGTSVFGSVGAGMFGLNAEVGASQWLGDGEMHGGSVYGEAYLGTKGSHYGIGYQQGWGGQSSGFYQTASAFGVSARDYGDGWAITGASMSLVSRSVSSTGEDETRTIVDGIKDQWKDLKKASAVIPTVAGLAAGAVMTAMDWNNTSWHVTKDGFNVQSSLDWGVPGGGALTLGRTQLYGGSATPDDIGNLYGEPWLQRMGSHEAFHSEQYERDGLFGMGWNWIRGGGPNAGNPVEREANLHGMKLF